MAGAGGGVLAPRRGSSPGRGAPAAGAVSRRPGALDAPCAGSYGPVPGAVYAGHRFIDVFVHGWDLARATGQPYAPHEAAVLACLGFATSFEPPPEAGRGPFGPPVAVPDSAPALDRLAGATGRDPGWMP